MLISLLARIACALVLLGASPTLTAKAFDNLNASGTSAPVNVTVTGAITFLHNDFAGNPIAATDANGTILWKENFRPYGDRLNNQPAAATNRQWFHGKAVDNDTGLSYFGARYYDPTLGRFMGTDPQHFSESNLHSFNRYAYGNNNPYKYLDPDGQASGMLVPFAVLVGVVAIGGYQATKPPLGLQGRSADAGMGSSILTTPGETTTGFRLPGFSQLVDKLGNLIFKNPDGSPGKQDHRDKVQALGDKARAEAGPGETVEFGRKIRGHDSNRMPDVQIRDVNERTRKIFEAERNPSSKRNKGREAEYNRLGIPHETHGLSN